MRGECKRACREGTSDQHRNCYPDYALRFEVHGFTPFHVRYLWTFTRPIRQEAPPNKGVVMPMPGSPASRLVDPYPSFTTLLFPGIHEVIRWFYLNPGRNVIRTVFARLLTAEILRSPRTRAAPRRAGASAGTADRR